MRILYIISLLILSCNNNPSEPNDENLCTEENSNITCWDCSLVCSENECPDRTNSFPVIWDCDFNGVLDNYNDYQNNGSITSAVFMDDVNVVSPGDLLAAFVGDEQRGAAIPLGPVPFGPYEGTYQFLMLIYSNTGSGETIDLQFYDYETDEVYSIIETYQFISDMTEGDVKGPIIFTVE